MQKYVPGVLFWLFVINLGIAFGAGTHKSRVDERLIREQDAQAAHRRPRGP